MSLGSIANIGRDVAHLITDAQKGDMGAVFRDVADLQRDMHSADRCGHDRHHHHDHHRHGGQECQPQAEQPFYMPCHNTMFA